MLLIECSDAFQSFDSLQHKLVHIQVHLTFEFYPMVNDVKINMIYSVDDQTNAMQMDVHHRLNFR